ncbi:MAG: chemotaxis response regulator protein-glutamate methylesterase [Bacteroidota bacterium]
MKRKIKILIIDDSALVRQTLEKLFLSEPDFEVIGTAANPYFAAEKIKKQIPDVITLDVEMPRMDGLTFLKVLMKQKPIPVVVVSSLTIKGNTTAIKALELGAIDIVNKPSMRSIGDLQSIERLNFMDIIRAAARANVSKNKEKLNTIKAKNSLSADIAIGKLPSKSMLETTDKIVAIGASTGGTVAIHYVLKNLTYDCPPVAIVQHMPEHFTRTFAERMNNICEITVKEAENGDALIRGQALIAPGNKHMLVKRSGARYFVELDDGALVNRHKPSVDVLFKSTAQYAGKNAIGIIMTGMGKDGAQGLLEMKEAGAFTIAQNKESCVVYGMPQEAVRLGAAIRTMSLKQIPNNIMSKSSLQA